MLFLPQVHVLCYNNAFPALIFLVLCPMEDFCGVLVWETLWCCCEPSLTCTVAARMDVWRIKYHFNAECLQQIPLELQTCNAIHNLLLCLCPTQPSPIHPTVHVKAWPSAMKCMYIINFYPILKTHITCFNTLTSAKTRLEKGAYI